ncbi:MAG: SPFH/Band 7/PHB domain protein [Oscillospiraceae bacterium]|jgi:regulator of protease activity HflC (stomatin/prohibitin superfamily)|nr:SPFH/Band 7/PHB domain protein [Oscillospiraceae bacterium]
MTTITLAVLGVLVTAIIILIVPNIHIVPQSEVFVIERLGAFREVWETGVHVKIPFVDRIAEYVPLREQVTDYEPWHVTTKDGATIQIDVALFYQITDPLLYTYGVEHPKEAIQILTAATLRNVIGGLDFDEVRTSRNDINEKMGTVLKDATAQEVWNKKIDDKKGVLKAYRKELSEEDTDPWGFRIDRVEIKEIIMPPDVQKTVQKEMTAERERRAELLHAGARAEAITLLKEAAPGNEYLQLEAMKAFGTVANGQATKIFIPSDMQGIAGLAGLAQGINEAAGPGAAQS